MIKFYLILFTIIMIIAFTTRYFLKYIIEGDKLRCYRRGIVLFDILAVLSMSLGYGALKDSIVAGPLIQIIAIIFMSQILFCITMFIVASFRYIISKFNSVPYDVNRRRVIKKAAIIPVAAVASSIYASVDERCSTVVNRYTIPVDDFAKDDPKFTIAQISDVHMGPFFNLNDLKYLLEQTCELNADILTITGDLFDDVKQNHQAAKLIDEYVHRFPLGIFYCHGNHEHLRNVQSIEKSLSETRIRTLYNANEILNFYSKKIAIIGVDYPMDRKRFGELQEEYIQQALEGISDSCIKILLAHHPDFFDSAITRGINLTLSGHTHGGQIGLWGVPIVPPVFKYMRGLYQEGKSYCYVHCGNGSWFPYRLGCPPEIAIFTLEGK